MRKESTIQKLRPSQEQANIIEEIANMLMVNRRVDYIIERMNFYGHDGEKTKALGFCATVKHAKYMAEEFNKRLSKNNGQVAVDLSGDDSVEYSS